MRLGLKEGFLRSGCIITRTPFRNDLIPANETGIGMGMETGTEIVIVAVLSSKIIILFSITARVMLLIMVLHRLLESLIGLHLLRNKELSNP